MNMTFLILTIFLFIAIVTAGYDLLYLKQTKKAEAVLDLPLPVSIKLLLKLSSYVSILVVIALLILLFGNLLFKTS